MVSVIANGRPAGRGPHLHDYAGGSPTDGKEQREAYQEDNAPELSQSGDGDAG